MRALAGVLATAILTVAAASASASGTAGPRFSLSADAAAVNEQVTLRVQQAPGVSVPARELRLYLAPGGSVHAIRSRLDSRLSFIGFARSARGARLQFTVPPLTPGTYAVVYWCSVCLPGGKGIGLSGSTLRVNPAAEQPCPRTEPNGKAPPGLTPGGWSFHGNGGLFAAVPPGGRIVTNDLGGYKLIWAARRGVDRSAPLSVRYRLLDPPSAPHAAQTGSGTLIGYAGPSWASRMSFEPGCWQVTGRVRDLSLSFVVQVAYPDGR